MSDSIPLLTACLLTAWLTNISIKVGEPYKLGKKSQSLIEQCEAELPRNKKCTIKAVPEE